jgi:hypothetical protein
VDLGSLLTLLLMALFLAVQPWSVLAAILLVTAQDGMKKEIAYVGGWVTALVAVAVTTVLVYPDIPQGSTSSNSQAAVELGVGILFGGWLLWRWRNPKDAGTEKQPSWMARLDTMSPLLAVGLGAFLPSYFVVVAALDEMVSSGLSQGGLLLAALGWVLLASTGVASPLWPLVTDREHAPETYERWRTWITTHSRAVLFLVGALVSIVLIGKGLGGLIT